MAVVKVFDDVNINRTNLPGNKYIDDLKKLGNELYIASPRLTGLRYCQPENFA